MFYIKQKKNTYNNIIYIYKINEMCVYEIGLVKILYIVKYLKRKKKNK